MKYDEVINVNNDIKFRRVLLKLSGEAIADKKTGEIFDPDKIKGISDAIRRLTDDGVEVAVVIGAGNIWRGVYGKGLNRARADQMGMLGTMINSMRIEDALESAGCKVSIMSSIPMQGFAEPYDFRKARRHLSNGKVVILGGGLGTPFITTDTAAVVRGGEIGADVILMAKNIDGIYTADPRNDPDAKRYKVVSYAECLGKNLRATDASASAIAQDQGVDMYVFALSDPENIVRAVHGEEIGTLVTHDAETEPELY